MVPKFVGRPAGWYTVPTRSDGGSARPAQLAEPPSAALMAAEELVDRSVRQDVEVHREVDFERRAVRAGAMQGVGKGGTTSWPFWMKAPLLRVSVPV